MNRRPYAVMLTAAVIGAGSMAFAQGLVQAAPVAPDLTGYAKATDVQAAIASGIAAATPPDCTTPLADTLLGSAGTTKCMPHVSDTRPTAVQALNTTLNADCTWSGTFQRPFTSASPIVHAEAVLPAGSTQPMSCQPLSRSTTLQSGRCFQSQASTLAAVTVVGVSVAVGSQTVNPTATTCTAGVPIMVWGREPTQ